PAGHPALGDDHRRLPTPGPGPAPPGRAVARRRGGLALRARGPPSRWLPISPPTSCVVDRLRHGYQGQAPAADRGALRSIPTVPPPRAAAADALRPWCPPAVDPPQ